jgi:bifunctional UDP-N-acetylglucosamine pyrophosphorylase/glucosamine-1-phosphate N-acetyltransferase
MQAVILAAGHGSRLQPITLTRSKAMVPILGKPIVERVMEDFQANGIDDFILVVSTRDRHITRYFRHESQLDADVRFVYQPKRLGMANALQWAAQLITGDFFLSACDNLISSDYVSRMLEAWHSEPRPNAVLTLMPVEPERLGSVGIVEMNGHWVTRIIEKPSPEEAPSDISSLPLYCFSKRILDLLDQVPLSPRGEYELQDAIQMLIEREGNVRGEITDQRLTLTSPTDLLAINRHYLISDDDQPQLAPSRVGPNTQLVTPLRIEHGTAIGRDCRIGPDAYIERDCTIGDGVVIRNAVVLRESDVPAGAVIENQVIS